MEHVLERIYTFDQLKEEEEEIEEEEGIEEIGEMSVCRIDRGDVFL